MVSQHLSSLPAVRKQHLLVELRLESQTCLSPWRVHVTHSRRPHNMDWSIIRPYAPAILRFQMSFPPSYPSLPPLVTFSTDIFHPLITPLTTYMYTTDIQDTGTVSATDDERLPPGGFSLRDGFPGWFGRGARRSAERSRLSRVNNMQTPIRAGTKGVESPLSASSLSPTPGPRTLDSSGGTGVSVGGKKEAAVSTYDVLLYIRSTFDDAEVLDTVSLEAAGNPGAWHAWRTHRIRTGALMPTPLAVERQHEKVAWHDGLSEGEESNSSGGIPNGSPKLSAGENALSAARRPGEWSWEGVWEVRVKKGVEGSLAESVLFGNTAGSDLIRFLNMEGDEVETIKENIRRSLESVEPQRRGVV